MTRSAALIPVLLLALAFAGPVFAQSTDSAEQLRLGRAAMAAHDPTAAIRHFEQADIREGREGLAIALMTESRSASDQYVERAFDAAIRARADQPATTPSRAELAAAMRPGDMAIAFLIGDTSAWAWAFDRDALIGYPLPAPAEIATAATRARAYITSGDREGIARIADDLMPALLGPAYERLPQLRRIIFVMDGPLKSLPIGALPSGEGQPPLQERLAVAVVDSGQLLEAITTEPASPAGPDSAWSPGAIAMATFASLVVLIAVIAAFARRSR